eukprot:15188_1
MPVHAQSYGGVQHNMQSSHLQSMQSYNYNSGDHMNGNTSTNHQTPPRQTSNDSHSSGNNNRSIDYSPIPYTAKQAAQNQNPPQFNLHQPNPHDASSMYGHPQHPSYQQAYHQRSYDAYQQTKKRHRSVSADDLLTPYNWGKASQQPSMSHRYDSPHHHQQQPANYYNTNEQLPSIQPHMDGTRMSNTIPYGDPINSLNEMAPHQSRKKMDNNSTPPPLTAEQAARSNLLFNDPSMLRPPRVNRSLSHADLIGTNTPISKQQITKMRSLQLSSSLPSTENKETHRLLQQHLIISTPPEVRRRPRTGSAPLPPSSLPKYNMISNSIWRTNPNQDPNQSASNSNSNPNGIVSSSDPQQQQKSNNTTPSHSNKDPFSNRRLKVIPDNDAAYGNAFNMVSPKDIDIENIIKTPKDINVVSPGTYGPYGPYFGFSEVLSPTDLKNAQTGNPLIVPTTPPPPPSLPPRNKSGSASDSKMNYEIIKLRKELETANVQIEQLKFEQKSKPSIDDTPSFGASVKKSINLKDQKGRIKANDDEKHRTDDDIKMDNKQNNDAENLKSKQLARYQHFITCPSCKSTQNARNQVGIPCGHLICNKCSSETKNKHKCPLCSVEIKNYQLLYIG